VTVIAGWLVAAWQMTLGFTLGLQFAYLLLVLGVGVAALLALRRLPVPSSRVVVATALGVVVLLGATAFMARPYLRVLDAHPEARRTPAYVETFSAGPRGLFAGPEESWIWSDVTRRARASLDAPAEMSLFPGLAIGLLALLGVVGSVLAKPLRLGLAVGVVVCALFSLGLRDVDGPQRYLTPFRLLFDFAPGWDGVRTPGRIATLTSLGLALLAGAGLCALVRRARLRSSSVATAVGVLGFAVILLEGLGPLTHPPVPEPPAAVRLEAAPQLNLPAGFKDDLRYSYWSTAGFPETVNGAGGFDPDAYDALRKRIAGFPDAASVRALRDLGVRSVLLHPDSAAGTSWEGAETRPVAGLSVERERIGDVVVFRLR
jgi:hypothetical protein